jgi:hypothetical protein
MSETRLYRVAVLLEDDGPDAAEIDGKVIDISEIYQLTEEDRAEIEATLQSASCEPRFWITPLDSVPGMLAARERVVEAIEFANDYFAEQD